MECMKNAHTVCFLEHLQCEGSSDRINDEDQIGRRWRCVRFSKELRRRGMSGRGEHREKI